MPRKDTINRFDLQESGDFTWRVSDSVKNWWELVTGDDGVCFRLTKQRGSQKKEEKCGYECISLRALNWLV